jgi:hypothetical protein
MVADTSGTCARSEGVDCTSEERGMYYHTQMHDYPACKGVAVLYKITVSHAEHCDVVGGEAWRRHSQY